MAVWSYCGGWQLWRCFPLLQKLRVGVDFYAWRSEYSTASMSLFFCGVVFSFPRLRYKNPSTCSIIFRLPLLEKISPNRLVCVFFWVAVIAKLQEEESRFFLLPEGLFFIARHQIEPFLHIYCKIFCRRFVFVLCTKGFCFNHEYPGFFYILAGTNHICRAYIADFFYQAHLF